MYRKFKEYIKGLEYPKIQLYTSTFCYLSPYLEPTNNLSINFRIDLSANILKLVYHLPTSFILKMALEPTSSSSTLLDLGDVIDVSNIVNDVSLSGVSSDFPNGTPSRTEEVIATELSAGNTSRNS